MCNYENHIESTIEIFTNVKTYWLLIKDPEQNAAGDSIFTPPPMKASLSLKEEL